MKTTNCTLFDNRTLQKAFIQDAIKAILKKLKKPLRLENEKDGRSFISAVHDYLIKHESHNLYTTYFGIVDAFKKYGINNGTELIIAIFERREELATQGYRVEMIKDPAELIKKYNIQAHNTYIDMDTTRTLVVRSKYGTTQPLFYDWNGPLRDCPELWAIRLDYHYRTGCKYFETRPILYSTWMDLPKERQIATCIADGTDFDEVEEMVG